MHFIVSIPQWCDCCLDTLAVSVDKATFQSHNGAIAALLQLLSPRLRARFNPTMVRLLHVHNIPQPVGNVWFQSHNGAIAAKKSTKLLKKKLKVSIPQWCDCCCMRRLLVTKLPSVSIPQWCDCCKVEPTKEHKAKLVSIPQWCDCCHLLRRVSEVVSEFQSHNGAIAAYWRRWNMQQLKKFQSHNGAIAALRLWAQRDPDTLVSIPQWCDCCSRTPNLTKLAHRVSIPQWCDCCLLAKPAHIHDREVSIPQWCDCCWALTKQPTTLCMSFNPTMVRLLLFPYQPSVQEVVSFNPTMVRLLHTPVEFVC